MTTGSGHILVVDDNRVNRLKISRSLELQGHTVDTAEDGAQALDMIRQGAFDVVLLDIMMPVLDGYGVLEAMKDDAELRRIPVIVISALDELDSVVRCIEMGAEDYLPKNFDPVLLQARIAASLRRKKLSDLEQAYLQQEVMLRQSEKLATLGRLSAGMAHELNNPASAALSGSRQMRQVFDHLLETGIQLSDASFTTEQTMKLKVLLDTVTKPNTETLDSLARSDREYELEEWLEDAGINEDWEFAPALVELDIQESDLEDLSETFAPQQLKLVIEWLVATTSISEMIDIISEGAGRIAGIVGALKNYSYLDQAPMQSINVHEGLDNTLLMLNSRLKGGVTVTRHYADDLPSIDAYGSELNQVWTNIIDNAISAMDGKGEISLKTYHDEDGVVIEIADNGPGIPPDKQTKVFDPFFTTKPPGEGTGLGLNISHNIIVEKHAGEITVASEPGRTCFQVKLPLVRPNDEN